MPQFLILAHDGDDEAAPARRAAARPAHFAAIRPLVEGGQLMAGGAILNDSGTMVGSVVLVEFASRAELDAWLASDPYVTEGVWRRIEVLPFRVAVLDGKTMP